MVPETSPAPLRVLMVTGIFPPDIGGPATYVPMMAEGLARRGHRVTVVTLSDRFDHDDSKWPFEVVRLRRHEALLWRILRTIRMIFRLGREADVLFVNGLALEAALANAILRKPLVVKVVGDWAWERARNKGWTDEFFEEFQQRRHGLRVRLLEALRTWVTRRADRMIVPSEYLARFVQGWGVPKERISVIYNAAAVPQDVEARRLVDLPLQAAMVGRLVPLKRVEAILEAVAELESVGLVLVGDGPERSGLEEVASNLGLADRVHFTGRLSHRRTIEILAGSDALVLLSEHEGFPHVVLEALALGVPVVATPVGGVPEIIKDGKNGYLLLGEGNLSEEVRSVLGRLEHNQELVQELRTAALITAKQFDADIQLDATEASLDRLARGKSVSDVVSG